LRRLQSRLPRSSYPRYTLAVDRFPLTSSGKIDRAALRQWLEQKGIPRQSRATGADSFKPEAD
jgi:acyl-CoA synthetase (AMP-forming)/AMP-acid ligase II